MNLEEEAIQKIRNELHLGNVEVPGDGLIVGKEHMRQKMEKMDSFNTGATRNNDDDKLDYEGHLSPLALKEYVTYCNKHRTQADGKRRASDNWQLGIPIPRYMKSLWRHFMNVWTAHRKWDPTIDIKESLCATIFNAHGMLHEILKAEMAEKEKK